jgi:antitoxin (DNA-binding transcriptional repressor) of toxin-antitoxin stability system
MKTVSPEYAARHFSELMEEVAAGEEILVADESGAIARILPLAGEADGSKPSEEADAPSEEVEQAFYGD